jgi:hypothetical protein
MDPEHGRIWIYDLDRAIQGFTPDGVEHLKERSSRWRLVLVPWSR